MELAKTTHRFQLHQIDVSGKDNPIRHKEVGDNIQRIEKELIEKANRTNEEIQSLQIELKALKRY